MESESTPFPAPKGRELTIRPNKDGIQYFYANNVSLGTTAFDVRLVFGEIVDITDEKLTVEQRLQVTMSWLETKILSEFLRVNVQAFEEKNGALKMPELTKSVVIPEMKDLQHKP
jgi:Protein of unknown function (DUF3467)